MLAEGGGGTPPLLKISNFFFNPSLVDLDFIMKGVVISIKSRLKKKSKFRDELETCPKFEVCYLHLVFFNQLNNNICTLIRAEDLSVALLSHSWLLVKSRFKFQI